MQPPQTRPEDPRVPGVPPPRPPTRPPGAGPQGPGEVGDRRDRDRNDRDRNDRDRNDRDRNNHDRDRDGGREPRGNDSRRDRDSDRHDHADRRRPDSNSPRFPVSPGYGHGGHRPGPGDFDNEWQRRHRHDFSERFRHGHLRHWHGYNHRSRSSLSIRCYDPFYFDWVYWGGNYYYWRGVSYTSWNSHYLWDYTYTPVVDTDVEPDRFSPIPACFPPAIPPLGAPPPTPELLGSGGVPEELRLYLNEPFYSVLGSRLLLGELSDAQRRELDAYRQGRDEELAHLQRVLANLGAVPPGEALQRLADFASDQTPRLRSLEAQAESLRRSLLLDEVATPQLRSVSWSVYREFFLTRGASDADKVSQLQLDYLTLRAIAYYQDGLSRTQRDLLRDAAAELQVKAYQARGGFQDLAATNAPVLFSPGGAKLLLPEGLPAPDAARLQAYVDRKAQLAQALVDQIRLLDGASERVRRDSLESYARQSEAAYAELEAQAEALRPILYEKATLPGVTREASVLPDELRRRIHALSVQRSALAEEYRARFAELNSDAQPGHVRVLNLDSRDPEPGVPPTLVYVPALRTAENVREQQRRRVQEFNEQVQGRNRELAREEQAILSQLQMFVAKQPAAAKGRSAARLLELEVQAARSLEFAGDYTLYLQAALQPALSLEQRRLLFGAGLAQLKLTLPLAE